MAPVRPAELLENLHGVMDQIADGKGLRLTSEIDDHLPDALNGDAARLQQILVNLVNNAVLSLPIGAQYMSVCFAPTKTHGAWKFLTRAAASLRTN